MFGGPSKQKTCIANAIAIAIKKQWKLVLPDLRFNYDKQESAFVEPLDFMFNISALNTLLSHGYGYCLFILNFPYSFSTA